MHSRTNTRRTANETDLLRELFVNGSADRAQLLTLLCEQAPPISEIPALPDELRARLEDKFGPPPHPWHHPPHPISFNDLLHFIQRSPATFHHYC